MKTQSLLKMMSFPVLALLLATFASPSTSSKPATPTPVYTTREAAPAAVPVAALGDPQELDAFIDGMVIK